MLHAMGTHALYSLRTNCKILVPSSDTVPCGYMWVSGFSRLYEIHVTTGKFQPINMSFAEQYGSSNDTSNVYSEGAGLKSQLQHQLSLSSF
jgi:hypothetical protein